MYKKNDNWVPELVYEIMQIGVDERTACDLVLEWQEMIDSHMEQEREKLVNKACEMVRTYLKGVKYDG